MVILLTKVRNRKACSSSSTTTTKEKVCFLKKKNNLSKKKQREILFPSNLFYIFCVKKKLGFVFVCL
jgi:hypothetical protein